jgi:undecaprenyl-diphosphatase
VGMQVHEAALLGVIQGLTEFLPVSSSGHLVLFQNLFGLPEPEIYFDISVHVGTLIAVCVFFLKDLKEIAAALFSTSTWHVRKGGLGASFTRKTELRLFLLILAGTVPTAIMGLLLRPIAPRIFSSVQLVGIMLFATGLLLWLTRRLKKGERNAGQMTAWDALCIGIIQGVAILPGISRSGATIAVGLFRSLDRETAARYSFLLSIPAILGAMVLELIQTPAIGSPPFRVILVGASIAAAIGYVALSILVHLVKKGDLHYFAPYCWVLGLVTVVSSF